MWGKKIEHFEAITTSGTTNITYCVIKPNVKEKTSKKCPPKGQYKLLKFATKEAHPTKFWALNVFSRPISTTQKTEN